MTFFQKLIYLVFILTLNLSYSQVGINTTSPKGIMDIESSDKGLVIPRVDLVFTTQELPVTNPNGGPIINSTLVYNKQTINDVYPGYYYWENGRWIRLSSEPAYMRFTTVNLPVLINNDVDFSLLGVNYTANIFRLTHTVGVEFGGISNGVHGRVIYIYNGGTTDIKLLSQTNATGTTAINRFSLNGDIILRPGNSVMIYYDGLYLNRWIVVISGN